MVYVVGGKGKPYRPALFATELYTCTHPAHAMSARMKRICCFDEEEDDYYYY